VTRVQRFIDENPGVNWYDADVTLGISKPRFLDILIELGYLPENFDPTFVPPPSSRGRERATSSVSRHIP
jgi:hypothetical protein